MHAAVSRSAINPNPHFSSLFFDVKFPNAFKAKNVAKIQKMGAFQEAGKTPVIIPEASRANQIKIRLINKETLSNRYISRSVLSLDPQTIL